MMGGIGKYKLSEAIRFPIQTVDAEKAGKPLSASATTAEQVRQAQESSEALNAEASIRDRMIEIGRGNQQAGRQGQ